MMPRTYMKSPKNISFSQHFRTALGAKQRRGGLAPLSAPEQILRNLAREQRHLAYLERGGNCLVG